MPDSGGHGRFRLARTTARLPRRPPSETREELRILADLIAGNDAATAAQIAYWDAGAPQYRWIDLISNRVLAGTPTGVAHRVYTYVAMAMYDATIATWESKYHYRRPRPTQMDHRLPTAVAVPDSPSYPSEHSAAAQAAATVLAYFLPLEAQNFQAMAEQAGMVTGARGRAVPERPPRGSRARGGEWRNR